MAGTVVKVRAVPVWVKYGGVDLGYTKGGSSVTHQVVTAPIIVQANPLDIVVIRKEVTADVNLAETSYSKLESILNLDLDMGDDLLDYTATLTLTATDDPTDITTILSAYCVGNTRASFMFENIRVWPVQFKAIYTAGDMSFAEIT